MRVLLKNLAEQVMVITGASSGIGLVTARMAARRGAKLVISSRNEEALKRIAAELTGMGAEVAYVVADVGREEDVRAIADKAIERFGGFDTWVNNAGVSIFGRFEDVPLTDQHKLFQTNFWGVVHGSLIAAEHLKQRGGAIINLGSELSDVAVPLQGMYSASKHAVKGFTDALRLELEHARAGVSVTLIKPAALDTLFLPHAKNYMNVEPKLPQPVYAPDLAADAILYAAEHPRRDIFVGGAARITSVGARMAPRTTDWVMRLLGFSGQRSDQPAGERQDILHQPGRALRERNGGQYVFENSLITRAELHPKTSFALAIGALALIALWRMGRPPVRQI
jgi:short-subunit dehydrogenase